MNDIVCSTTLFTNCHLKIVRKCLSEEAEEKAQEDDSSDSDFVFKTRTNPTRFYIQRFC